MLIQLISAQTQSCPPPLAPLPPLGVPAGQPPGGACPFTPIPTQLDGYLPFTFVNNSGLPASEIYIAVVVNSNRQYLSFGGSPHKLATIANFTPITYISNPIYTHALSDFENTGPNEYTFYVPNDGGLPGAQLMQSSRILISLKQPLTYFINNLGVLQIHADVIATDDNYYILNDKIEFDIGSNNLNRINLNLTWVDFFGLPMLIRATYNYLKGTDYILSCATTGLPSSVGLSDVFTQYDSALDSLVPPFNGIWKGLQATYTNPSSIGSTLCNLRIFAPATAMGSTQQQTNPSKVFFPTNYFLNTISSPAGCTWFNAVWDGETSSGKQAFYKVRKPTTAYLVLDATTSPKEATATGFEDDSGTFNFTISGLPDNGRIIQFPKPTTSKAFFTGAASDYEPKIIPNGASAATVSQILKVFATSIIAGFFPINCQPNMIRINSDYVQAHSSQYFQNNPILTSMLDPPCPCVGNVPWYDFYSRAMLTIGTPNLFYTSAYSDFLGTDGTIVIINLRDHNQNARITIDLNDMTTGVNFPDPYADTTLFNITVNEPQTVSKVEFSTSASGPWVAVPPSATGDKFFLRVQYSTGPYAGPPGYITQIAPSVRAFHPILPLEGVITTNGVNTTIALGGPKPENSDRTSSDRSSQEESKRKKVKRKHKMNVTSL